tara:strand:- start:135 stop:506 length:372 start_codon:yes stop_codon:yes gene_type:complete
MDSEQVPPSQSPNQTRNQPPFQPPFQESSIPQITPEQLAAMKARAKELAIQQTLAQKEASQYGLPREELSFKPQPPKVVYVRRNPTIAEIALMLMISTLLVTGVQFSWKVVTDFLPRIEINVK